VLRTGATWLAGRETLPTALRAVVGYYGEAGVLDPASLRLKARVDDTTEAMLDDAFGAVEEALAEAFGVDYVRFDYDTKLVLPAQLTLGHLYRRTDGRERRRAEALTRLVIEALVDGDMRDAVNDDEFEDFAVDVADTEADRRRAAEIAQATLAERVAAGFEEYPASVREAYEAAVETSEAHQEEDEHFRGLMAAARGEGDADGADRSPAAAREAIRAEYRDADFAERPALFDATEADLPYVKTQYDRVGVIYDGMFDMYEGAGFAIDERFRRSVVLAIIGAQVWLDDVDDYHDDVAAGQLTPVTAEYLLAEDDRAGYRGSVAVAEAYLERARADATAAGEPLTGIATEYIYRSGDPETLPGSG
jgi:hypothetical protein